MKKYFSTFVGITLPQEIKDKYNLLLDEIRPISRLFDLASRRTPHITLNFFGEANYSDLERIDQKLLKNLESLKNIKLEIKGLDHFSPGSPRVVFLEIKENDELKNAQEELKETFELSEEKEFHPHLTLFRLRSEEAQKDFENNIEKIKEIVNKINWEFEIEKVAIFGVDQDSPRDGQQIIFQHTI